MGLAPEKASRIKAGCGMLCICPASDPWSKSEEIDHLVMGRGVRCTWTWDQLVSVPNVSWMVAILVHRHVPILDNGGTGLTDPWLLYHSPINI